MVQISKLIRKTAAQSLSLSMLVAPAIPSVEYEQKSVITRKGDPDDSPNYKPQTVSRPSYKDFGPKMEQEAYSDYTWNLDQSLGIRALYSIATKDLSTIGSLDQVGLVIKLPDEFIRADWEVQFIYSTRDNNEPIVRKNQDGLAKCDFDATHQIPSSHSLWGVVTEAFDKIEDRSKKDKFQIQVCFKQNGNLPSQLQKEGINDLKKWLDTEQLEFRVVSFKDDRGVASALDKLYPRKADSIK